MKRLLTAVSMLAVGLSSAALAQTSPAAPAAAPAGPSKIGIIFFQQAVAATNEGQRELSDVQHKFEPKKTELDNLSTEIENLKKQLQTAGDKLSDEERATRTKTLDSKEKSLQRQAEDAQNDYQTELNTAYSKIAQKFYSSLEEYSKQNNYTVVLDAGTQQTPVVWAAQSSNITEAVVSLYNTKSGVPAPAPSAPRPSTTKPATPKPGAPK